MWPSQHLEFGLLASRRMKEYISVVLRQLLLYVLYVCIFLLLPRTEKHLMIWPPHCLSTLTSCQNLACPSSALPSLTTPPYLGLQHLSLHQDECAPLWLHLLLPWNWSLSSATRPGGLLSRAQSQHRLWSFLNLHAFWACPVCSPTAFYIVIVLSYYRIPKHFFHSTLNSLTE